MSITVDLTPEQANLLRDALQWLMAETQQSRQSQLSFYDEDAGVWRHEEGRKTAGEQAMRFAVRHVADHTWRQMKRPGSVLRGSVRLRLHDAAYVATLIQALYHLLTRRADWQAWQGQRGESAEFDRAGIHGLLEVLRLAEARM